MVANQIEEILSSYEVRVRVKLTEKRAAAKLAKATEKTIEAAVAAI